MASASVAVGEESLAHRYVGVTVEAAVGCRLTFESSCRLGASSFLVLATFCMQSGPLVRCALRWLHVCTLHSKGPALLVVPFTMLSSGCSCACRSRCCNCLTVSIHQIGAMQRIVPLEEVVNGQTTHDTLAVHEVQPPS
jgi:hypothetical protein